jgi:hypothetical protein
MRVIAISLTSLLPLAFAACGGAMAESPATPGRALTGESDAARVVAVDTHGHMFVAQVTNGAFRLVLTSTTHPLRLFTRDGSHYAAVKFPVKRGGAAEGFTLPNGDTTVSVGKLSTAPGSDTSAEDNPLDQIDQDGDGDSDLDDDDDDGDGVPDDVDADDDGEAGDDADHDLDSDDDGEADLCDDDDDGDGVDDAHDDDDDRDGDGVSDDEDEDDDNDGTDDDEGDDGDDEDEND